MQYNIFAQRDATLYEIYPTRNTGRDSILELTKIACGSMYEGNSYGVNYNSRILVQFNTNDLTTAGISQNAKYYLSLRTAESSELPYEYTIYAYPVSRSWDVGYGDYNSKPPITDDVSWTYRVNKGSTQTAWSNAGGDYYTFVPSSSISSSLSQSFQYTQPTINTPGNFVYNDTGTSYQLDTTFNIYLVGLSGSAHSDFLTPYVFTANTGSPELADTFTITYSNLPSLATGSFNDNYDVWIYKENDNRWFVKQNIPSGELTTTGITVTLTNDASTALNTDLQNAGFSLQGATPLIYSNTNTIYFTSSILTPSSSVVYHSGSSLVASQSFAFADPDIRMDVTNIVKAWLSGSIPNNGFIIKHSAADETSGDILGDLKFFSTDTNTIYIPKLEAVWDDSTFATGSLTEINDDNMVIYFKNLQANYREATNAKFRIGVRPAYPALTYSTSSNYLINYYLPTSSYYSVKDTVTEETIIPFDTNYTKISCDSNGSYFNLKLNAFLPERFYRIIIKTVQDGGDKTLIHDNGYYFKVVR